MQNMNNSQKSLPRRSMTTNDNTDTNLKQMHVFTDTVYHIKSAYYDYAVFFGQFFKSYTFVVYYSSTCTRILYLHVPSLRILCKKKKNDTFHDSNPNISQYTQLIPEQVPKTQTYYFIFSYLMGYQYAILTFYTALQCYVIEQ